MMHRTEPTAQQNLALQLAEKLGNLVENNERVFDHKQGSYGGYFRGPPRPRATPPRHAPPRPAPRLNASPLFSTPQIKKTATGKETAATCAAAATVNRSAAPTTEPRPATPLPRPLPE